MTSFSTRPSRGAYFFAFGYAASLKRHRPTPAQTSLEAITAAARLSPENPSLMMATDWTSPGAENHPRN